MEGNKNKFGLARHIPSDIRAKIRTEAGFGCVLCGCVLVDYEHIDPEFHQAKQHDPDRMTLLCISCHGRVTRKLISKKAVWEAKKNPKSLQDGYVHDLLYVNTNEMEIHVGSCISKNTKIFLSIHGKPIIWFEPPLVTGEPSKLCAIFYDDNGQIASFVNRNQFVAYSNNQDVISQSTTLSVRSNDKTCLSMMREGGNVLQIVEMHAQYLDVVFNVSPRAGMEIRHGNSTISVNGARIESCGNAFYLGNHLVLAKYNKLSLAISLAHNNRTRDILNLNGSLVGWVLGDEIFNLNYEVVGVVRSGEVFTVANEFIGLLKGSYIAFHDDCYEHGEPIFISIENRRFKNQNPTIGFDLSFRLFEEVA